MIILFLSPIIFAQYIPKFENQADVPISELYKFTSIKHPNTIYKLNDIEKAKENIKFYDWANTLNNSIVYTAKYILTYFDDSYIEKFIPRTTPSTTTFCPNCHATGKNWHPNGDWSWSSSRPDEITCNVCGMTFPNENYPEILRIRSTWDPEQEFSYVDNGPVQCMFYEICRSSIEGVIRGKKLNHIATAIFLLAKGYIVSNNSEYALYVRKALHRLAEVMPKYLVYAGYSYSEYCDMDPHEVVKDPTKCDRFIFAPGNEPKVGLYDNYWSASRLGTSGMDGLILTYFAQAYDLTADAVDANGQPIYSDEEKEFISKNCLVEGALLGFYDTSINNKAVFNREACTCVGLATGSSILTRFGLYGFLDAFSNYYLPDGGTPESASYSLMVIEGIHRFGYMLRDYSDPADFVPPEGEIKYSHFDPFTDTNFYEVFQSLIWTTNGDFSYPPVADTYYNSFMAMTYLELMLLGFDTDIIKRYVAERYNGASPPNDALFYRDPSINLSQYEPFDFPDIVFPYLLQGFLRTGDLGRKSTMVLDASNYGGHHHIDSLNIVYTKDGRELLHDLGYLWDHPNHSATVHTNIHNTVYIDKVDQLQTGCNGSFHLFATHSKVKAMQASSNAYFDVYNRTLVQIEHQNGKSYLVDIFRASGGKIREYLFHGVHHNYKITPNLAFGQPYVFDPLTGIVRFALSKAGQFDITNAILREKFKDGSYGPDFIGGIPDSFDGQKCPTNGAWCHYNGGGSFVWEVIPEGPNGENAVHFETTAPSEQGHYNVALNVGNCDGYVCPKENGIQFNPISTYEFEFMIKGNVTPRIFLQYWKLGEELSPNGRQFIELTDFSSIYVTNTWKRYVGTFQICKVGEVYGAETNDEVKIKWDIDENYTFTSFIPARNAQKIYYQEGFGQRDHTNTDAGATIPNFYIYRDEVNETSVFVNVFEGNFKGKEIVNDVQIKEINNGSVIIEVKTKDGTDYVLSSFDGNVIEGFNRITNARLAVEIGSDLNSTVMFDGTFFTYSKGNITTNEAYSGTILGYKNTKTDSWFEIKVEQNQLLLENIEENLQCIYVTDDDGNNIERPYPIKKIEKDGDRFQVYTRIDSVGFRTQETKKWRIGSIGVDNRVEEITPTDIFTASQIHSFSPLVPQESSKSGLSAGGIAAISIVVIIIISIVIAVSIMCIRKHQEYQPENDSDRNLLISELL